jgi:hypothetical protein
VTVPFLLTPTYKTYHRQQIVVGMRQRKSNYQSIDQPGKPKLTHYKHIPNVMNSVAADERCECEPKVVVDGKEYHRKAEKVDCNDELMREFIWAEDCFLEMMN